MSQAQLPARPDLQYLKKLAKERLAEMRAKTPHSRLADAQLAVAREHGFASWRKLRAHIEAMGIGAQTSESLAAQMRGFAAGVDAGDVEATRKLLKGSARVREKSMIRFSISAAGRCTGPVRTRH
jgi:hypothetical protein